MQTSNDPWWDLDGAGVKRDRIRRRIVGGTAFAIAIVACGLTSAVWLRTLEPVFRQAGLG
jgi:hypothetical protein